MAQRVQASVKEPRKEIPARIREIVLKEFNYNCSICGLHSPQIHHIDENPGNNDPNNLLPLCHLHHLRDQHHPTRQIEVGILRLFRKYQDIALLTPQFRPFYKRITFLEEIPEIAHINFDETWRNSDKVQQVNVWHQAHLVARDDLFAFVSAMKQGEYYAQNIRMLIIAKPKPSTLNLELVRGQANSWIRQFDHQLLLAQAVNDSLPSIYEQIIDLLSFQEWLPKVSPSSRNFT